MKDKIKKGIESLFVLVVVLCAPIAIAGLIKIHKELDMLHDFVYHTNDLARNVSLHLDKVEKAFVAHEHPLPNHSHGLDAQYAQALKEIKQLIKLVRENGEYCVKKGDIGCGQ